MVGVAAGGMSPSAMPPTRQYEVPLDGPGLHGGQQVDEEAAVRDARVPAHRGGGDVAAAGELMMDACLNLCHRTRLLVCMPDG